MRVALALLGVESIVLALSVLLPATLLSPARAADAIPPEPVPVRRLLITPDRLPFELQRLRQGTLVQMPREEFEARMAEAARASAALKNPPRLVEARYQARLVETALVGNGQWTITHPGSGPAFLPLQPFNLALRQLRRDQGAALLGELDGKSLGLLVEQSGTQTVSLDWSARGEQGPAGIRFEVKVPRCARNTFELELPADHAVTLVGDTWLLSGPLPAATPELRRWQFLGSSAAPLDLLIRRSAASGELPALVLARLRTKQRLAQDLVEADYDFNLEVLHGGIHELVCEGDPTLHPIAVSVGNAEIDTWEVRPGATATAPFTLGIRLRERFSGSLLPLRIHCLAPAAGKERWTSPALQVRGAVLQGETLTLQLVPDVHLEDWQAGTFELIKAAPEANGEQTLTLQSGLGEAAGTGREPSAAARIPAVRPSARIRGSEPEYRVRQASWWQIGADTTSLTVHLEYDMVRGRVFRLPVLLPAGWSLDRVELQPPELVPNVLTLPHDQGSTLLVVELQRPLEASTTVRMTLPLHPTNPWPIHRRDPKSRPGEFSVAFPQVVPQGTGLWDGILALRIDPLYEATFRSPAVASAVDRKMDEPGGVRESAEAAGLASLAPLAALLSLSPWGGQPPDAWYPFRGQAVDGTLILRPRAPRVRARCTSEIAAGRAAVLTRLLLQPEVGTPDQVDLLVSAPVSGVWNWRTESGRNAVKSMQRLTTTEVLLQLLPLAAPPSLAAVGLVQPLLGQASLWRLTLAQPLREPLLLETTLDLVGEGLPIDAAFRLSPLGAGSPWEALTLSVVGAEASHDHAEARRWQVPLLAVLSPEPTDGEVQLYLAGGGVDHIDSTGLTEIATPSGPGDATPWRTFRYSRLPVALSLHGPLGATARTAPAPVVRAHLTTYVEPAGRLLNYYAFQVRNWKQDTFRLHLPAGAQLLAAKVEGRWLARPALLQATADATVVDLPAPAALESQGYEVVYALAYPTGILWNEVHAPAPVLPVAVEAFRRTWALPPGYQPLDDPRFLRHPGPNREFGETSKRLAWIADPAAVFPTEDWKHRQERLLAEADVHLRQREQTQATFGEILHYLTYELLKGQEVLIVDAVALREAGLHAAIPFNPNASSRNPPAGSAAVESALPSLRCLGLVCIPCRPAPLLTTQRRWAAWQRVLGEVQPISASIETAVAAALVHGHDPSGRFRTAADWLREGILNGASVRGENGSDPWESARLGSLAALPHPESWTEWEPTAGLAQEARLLLLNQDLLWGIAAALTGLLLVVWGWAWRHGARLYYGCTLTWLAVSVLGLLWLPAGLRTVLGWPLLAGMALPVASYLLTSLRGRTPPPSRTASTALAGILAGALAVGLPGQAAAPPASPAGERTLEKKEPTTVWLLPGPPTAPDKLQALVPPSLLEQLQALAHRGAAGLRGALLLSARYQGHVVPGRADFEAEFRLHSFAEERSLLALPLSGVDLREATVDGAVAYPEAVPAPQNGYQVRIQGRGAHTVHLRFSVRLPSAGAERDLRFTIPELAQSQLTLVASQNAHYLQAVAIRGGQQLHTDPHGVRLEADLGRVATLHVHWRQEAAPASPAVAEVKEVYYWDLQSTGSRLLALLDYAVTRGAVSELTIGLPESLEVRRVELIAPGAASVGPRLKEWRLSGTGNTRRLHLALQGAIASNVQVLLELVPQVPLAQRTLLVLPTPEGVSYGEGFLGYHLKGVRGAVARARGLTEIEPTVLDRYWQPAGIDYPGLPERAYYFQRTSRGTPSLRLDLQAATPRSDCVQDFTWYVGPQQVEVRARAKLTTPGKDLALVEWEIPAALRIVNVRGADVRSWSRTESRLQVWLQRSVAETTLELAGWLMPAADALTLPSPPDGDEGKSGVALQPGRGDRQIRSPLPSGGAEGGVKRETSTFVLPELTVCGTTSLVTFVRLVADPGWRLHPEQLHHLLPLPDPQTNEQDQSYGAPQSPYGGVFHLRPTVLRADLQARSRVELRERRVLFTASLEYALDTRKPRTLTIRLRNWKGQDVRLEAPRAVRARESRRDPLARTWTLELPSSLRGPLQCQLTGILALEANADVVLPQVTVDEATLPERWVAIVGPGFRPEEQRGLSIVADGAAALTRWPAVRTQLRERGGAVWRVEAADWRLRLRTDLPSVESRPVQLFCEEQAAALLDGRRWLHQATYWLYQESGTHLGMILPEGALLRTASLDGLEIQPLRAGPNRLWLPLTGGGGLRVLRVGWVFNADRERLDVPRLERPTLENTLELPAEERSPPFWMVHIPPGHRLAHAGSQARPSSLVERFLHRAAAELRASSVLAEHAAGKFNDVSGRQLLRAQVQFYRHCREAEYELTLPPALRQQLFSAGALSARLQQLLLENQRLARSYRFETIRTQAEMQAASHPRTDRPSGAPASESGEGAPGEEVLTEQGTPTYWLVAAAQADPHLQLVPVPAEWTRQALGYSGLLILLLFLLALLPSYPRVTAWLRALSPEQIALLGALGWLVWGVNLACALLLLLGVTVRLIVLGRWLITQLRRPTTLPLSGSGVSSAT